MDEAVEKRARRQDHRPGPDDLARPRHHPSDPAVLDHQILHRGFDHGQTGRRLQRRLHRLPVELAIRLGARPLHRRPLAPVEQPELDARRIRDPSHQPVQRVHLAHQMPLAEPADGRVARHLADGRALLRHQRRARAEPGRGGSGLHPGVPAANDQNVEIHAAP